MLCLTPSNVNLPMKLGANLLLKDFLNSFIHNYYWVLIRCSLEGVCNRSFLTIHQMIFVNSK